MADETSENASLADVLRDYRDGDERGWDEEFRYLREHHSAKIDMLASSVQEAGIRKPILLGNDGRVWDGHHRLCVAQMLGLAEVPVTRIPAQQEADPCQARFEPGQRSDEKTHTCDQSAGHLVEGVPHHCARCGCWWRLGVGIVVDPHDRSGSGQ